MTVRQLLERLQSMPMTAEVLAMGQSVDEVRMVEWMSGKPPSVMLSEAAAKEEPSPHQE